MKLIAVILVAVLAGGCTGVDAPPDLPEAAAPSFGLPLQGGLAAISVEAGDEFAILYFDGFGQGVDLSVTLSTEDTEAFVTAGLFTLRNGELALETTTSGPRGGGGAYRLDTEDSAAVVVIGTHLSGASTLDLEFLNRPDSGTVYLMSGGVANFSGYDVIYRVDQPKMEGVHSFGFHEESLSPVPRSPAGPVELRLSSDHQVGEPSLSMAVVLVSGISRAGTVDVAWTTTESGTRDTSWPLTPATTAGASLVDSTADGGTALRVQITGATVPPRVSINHLSVPFRASDFGWRVVARYDQPPL